MNVLSIDPGRDKCGVAIVSRSGVLFRGVWETVRLGQCISGLLSQFRIDRVIVGDGTNSDAVGDVVSCILDVEPEYVDEYLTTMEARKRYFEENPPRGLARLIPISMQVPKVPFDDYVAIILAERYLNTLA